MVQLHPPCFGERDVGVHLPLPLANQNSQCCSHPGARLGFISNHNKSMGQCYLMASEEKYSLDLPEKQSSHLYSSTGVVHTTFSEASPPQKHAMPSLLFTHANWQHACRRSMKPAACTGSSRAAGLCLGDQG